MLFRSPIAKPASKLPRVDVKEPARTEEKRFVEYGQNVPLPAIAITYLAPRKADADVSALRVAQTILSGGESSRLYQALVYQQQIAAEAFGEGDLREDLGLFVVGAIVAGGKKPEDAEKALLAEIKKMQDTPVSAAELDKAKNQLITSQLQQRETSEGKASALGEAAVLLGDPNRVNTDLARLQAVTAADVQRVMKTYLGDAKPVVITYLPEVAKTDKTGRSEPPAVAGGLSIAKAQHPATIRSSYKVTGGHGR